jgi:hypothetical protein
VQAPVLSLSEPVTVEAAAVKNGLKKENGKYYYYVNGTKVKNTWKTVKTTSNGKTVSYKYYFGSNGAAYAGKTVYGVRTPVIKKINGKVYAFDVNGRMATGARVINGKFYVFNSKTGVYDKATTSTYRKAAAYRKDSKALKKLLGKASKTETSDSCYGDGIDVVRYYTYYIVSYFRDAKGKEIVLGISGR